MRNSVRMTTHHETVPLGVLVMAAFDVAAQYRADPREVSRLATTTVMSFLRPPQRRGAGAGKLRKLSS